MRLMGLPFHRKRTNAEWSKIIETRKLLKKRFGYYRDTNGNGVLIGNAYAKEVCSAKAIDKSNANGFTDEQHLKAALAIHHLWDNSVFIAEEQPNKRKKKQRGVTWRKFRTTFKTEGKECTVKLTVKHITNENDNILYSLELLP